MKVHKIEMMLSFPKVPVAICGYIPAIQCKDAMGEFEWKFVTCKDCLKKRKKKI